MFCLSFIIEYHEACQQMATKDLAPILSTAFGGVWGRPDPFPAYNIQLTWTASSNLAYITKTSWCPKEIFTILSRIQSHQVSN